MAVCICQRASPRARVHAFCGNLLPIIMQHDIYFVLRSILYVQRRRTSASTVVANFQRPESHSAGVRPRSTDSIIVNILIGCAHERFGVSFIRSACSELGEQTPSCNTQQRRRRCLNLRRSTGRTHCIAAPFSV